MKNRAIAFLLLVWCGAPAAAQTTDAIRIRQDVSGNQSGEPAVVREGQLRVVGRMKERMPVETRTTAGVPYSAEAVTESTQTLADGNRINHKATTRVYRDSEGRTRRDQISDSGAVESTFIVDPQTGTNYVFEQHVRETISGSDPGTVSNHDGPPDIVQFKGNMAAFAGGDVVFERKVEQGAKAEAEAHATAGPFMLQRVQSDGVGAGDGQAVREDLGTTTIEGLTATGTLTTTTIPAGAIGNLQPIKIVSEEWFSPDLKVLVLTKHSDPRTGETVYRLVNIVRAEPDPALFVVPAERNLRKSDIRSPE
jgi:hypothetical protein